MFLPGCVERVRTPPRTTPTAHERGPPPRPGPELPRRRAAARRADLAPVLSARSRLPHRDRGPSGSGSWVRPTRAARARRPGMSAAPRGSHRRPRSDGPGPMTLEAQVFAVPTPTYENEGWVADLA